MNEDWFLLANENHFWMKYRFYYFRKYCFSYLTSLTKIVEIGCGNCSFKRELENHLVKAIDGIDLNVKIVKECNTGKGPVYIYDVNKKDEMFHQKYEAVILMDVLEHIENDLEFLESVKFCLKEDGYLFINVPYGAFLFSKYDQAAGHIRRYDKKQLIDVLMRAGFQVEKSNLWGMLLLPIVMLRKFYLGFYKDPQVIVSKGFRPPFNFLNNLLRFFPVIESRVPFGRFFGTSLLVIARKLS